MIEKIEEKQKFLEEVKISLKNKYFGIDRVIDDIVAKLESWFIFDDVLIKPTIICLWGMTGIGKTNLVRDLVKLIGFYEKFIELDLSRSKQEQKYGSYDDGSILSRIVDVLDDTSDKGIVLFDEITKHRFSDTGDSRYSDIWNLLSYGRLSDGLNPIKRIDNAIDRLEGLFKDYDSNSRRIMYPTSSWNSNLSPEQIQNSVYNSMSSLFNPSQSPLSSDHFSILKFCKRRLKGLTFDDYAPLFDFVDYNQFIKSQYPFGFRNFIFRKIEAGEMTVDQILDIPNFVYVQPLIQVLNNAKAATVEKYSKVDGRDPLCYSKLLIFISGNLDGLYVDSKNINISPDELHEKTLNISLDMLKGALLEQFKPEEVSRFGSNHIIYNSLDSDSFRSIIKKNLEYIEKDIKSTSGIDVKLATDKFCEHIFSIGVIASQGVRPLISRLQTEANIYIPLLVKQAFLNNLTEISVDDVILNVV